jgi:fatty acid desaturase
MPAPVDEDAFAARCPAVLPDADADSLAGRRRRRLRVRLGVVGGIALIAVVVWALTDPGKPWIVWPLLGLGLVAALDAWFILAAGPLRESDVAEAGGERLETIRSLRRRRRFRVDAGALAILNLVLIGVWAASGSTYFWPVWPILGSAVALSLKSLQLGDFARERLVGDAASRWRAQ